MNDEVIGYFSYETTFSDICFFVAGVTLIIGDDFSLYEFFKGLFDVAISFDFEREGIEVF